MRKPASLNAWVDIRAVYRWGNKLVWITLWYVGKSVISKPFFREFYRRRPQGLAAAMKEVFLLRKVLFYDLQEVVRGPFTKFKSCSNNYYYSKGGAGVWRSWAQWDRGCSEYRAIGQQTAPLMFAKTLFLMQVWKMVSDGCLLEQTGRTETEQERHQQQLAHRWMCEAQVLGC